MPWTAPSGRTYKLCLLDTNAISEIVKHPQREGRGFVERFGPANHAPCFTIYNVIELRRHSDVYEKFLAFFAQYPGFLTKAWPNIVSDEQDTYWTREVPSPLLNAFSPMGSDATYDLRIFLERLSEQEWFQSTEANWKRNEAEVLEAWSSSRQNFHASKSEANATDALRYVKEAGVQTLIRLFPDWVQELVRQTEVPKVDRFPALQVMLYSQYYRLWSRGWTPRSQEVTDIQIMAAAPYVDLIVTERFQAEVFKKIRARVRRPGNLECVTIGELRPSL